MLAPRLKEEIKQLEALQKNEKRLMKLPDNNKNGRENPYSYKCHTRRCKLSAMYEKYFIIKHNLFKLDFERANEIIKKIFNCTYSKDLFDLTVKNAINHETEEVVHID